MGLVRHSLGYCTPGIIVSIYTLLTNNPSVPYLEEHLDGNLCRCTGYRPIWDAARSLCTDVEDTVRGPCGVPCRECPERDDCQQDCNVADKETEKGCCTSSTMDKLKEYKDTFLSDPSWREQPNKMFPKELLDEESSVCKELSKPLMVVDQSGNHPGGTWFKPTTFIELLKLLQEFGDPSASSPGYKIVVGNTEVGIETRFKHAVYPRLVFPSTSIQELFGFTVNDTSLVIGSCCPLSTIQYKCDEMSESSPRLKRTVLPIRNMLRWFASTQIRNVACLGGNLVTASPISDMNPMLAAMKGKLILSSLGDDGTAVNRRSVLVSDFFLRYRVVDLHPSEVVERVEVPILSPVFEYLRPFKQARRREDDISIVTSGMRIRLSISCSKFVIADIAMAFGGMAPRTILASKTANAMIGSEFCADTFLTAAQGLLDELKLPETVPGGQAAFRMTLATSFLYKFFLSCVADLKEDVEAIKANPSSFPDIPADSIPSLPTVDEIELSGTSNFLGEDKPRYHGQQSFPAPRLVKGLEDDILPVPQNAPKPQAAEVGKPSTHASGPLHCTGEALYADDIPSPPGMLHAALVLASQCGGVLESVDISPALSVPGVKNVYTHVDLEALGGSNELGPIVHDEQVFLPVGEKVRTVGQVIGVCIAESLESAELGARMVNVSYGEVSEKVIVSVEDAIAAKSFYDFAIHSMERGDTATLDTLSSTPDSAGTPKVGDIVKVSGTFRSGAQEHFYLETNSTLVVPSESDTNLTVYASTQAPTKTQMYCASATGTPASKVVVRMKRMGGGFGGKETRSVFASCAAAVAAKICSRPVRLTLARDVDMKLTGTRHVFVSEYSASAQITEDGAKLVAFDVTLYANGGCGFDLTGPVVDRALFHVDGCYNFPNFRAKVRPLDQFFQALLSHYIF